MLTNGSPVLYTDIVAAIRSHAHEFGIDPTNLAAHTPRISATVELVNAGVDTDTIDSVLRWDPASSANIRNKYARVSHQQLRAVQAALDTSKPSTPGARVYTATGRRSNS